MEKQVIPHQAVVPASVGSWLDLDAVAQVRLTSERADHPIESALLEIRGAEGGWRAAQRGPQTVWLHFDPAQEIRHIRLAFVSAERRTQEFALYFSSDGGVTYREIVRQQFNFSPGGASREQEDYFPHLTGVTDFKLTIVPDIAGGEAVAALQQLRIA
jgi:hypothetical protein